ncbi:hypothetical protein EZV62_008610 [Acer yangbiense]|uniref:MATH domain-containing protein n=1 Tax=Acer yangbiense TaxID=1000413 RepID=A0A5C7IEB5_9ROSI|nr:hypothetical protein EZV62_008610 [Acer yangbiense]
MTFKFAPLKLILCCFLYQIGDKSEFVEENAIQHHIAKLEDVNEYSKGRPKYLAHTRSPSDDGDFRWKLSLIYPIFMDTGSREGMVLIINYSVLVWKFLPEFLVKASVTTGAKVYLSSVNGLDQVELNSQDKLLAIIVDDHQEDHLHLWYVETRVKSVIPRAEKLRIEREELARRQREGSAL